MKLGRKKVSSKLKFFSDLIAGVIKEIEYKKVIRKLKKYDLIADVDDQRFHHFSSYWWDSILSIMLKILLLKNTFQLKNFLKFNSYIFNSRKEFCFN